MNLNTSIIDQQVEKLREDIAIQARDELGIPESKSKSLAFVFLCVRTMLDLDFDQAFDCLTEGGGDFGVDAMHISEESDGEFGVTIIQGKYKTDFTNPANFPANGIDALIKAIRYIFDPRSELGAINPRLNAQVEQARSMISDGYIPQIRAIACNNGLRWNDEGQQAIDRIGFGQQVTWEHIGPDVLVQMLQRTKQVNDSVRLAGKAIFEDMKFSRVCIGRVLVSEVAAIMRKHGDQLLERNIRRYLGLHGNRINESIKETLLSPNASNFYFFNNGLTLVCSDFNYNALQASDFTVKLDDLQIVNGGQTCMTILKTEDELLAKGESLPADAYVLVRIYKLPKDNEDLILQITHATNSQNPVDLRDLRSNNQIQLQLEESIRPLGYTYRRKRMEGPPRATDITSGAAAEAVLAVWRSAPHQAKFLTREHFGKLYDTIFQPSLNGAQVVTGVLLYRIAENHRRRPISSDPEFVRYASCFIAMQMGRRLLQEMRIELPKLDHRNFDIAKDLIDAKGDEFYSSAVQDIQHALVELYGQRTISLQQLSATFRRGDLIDYLLSIDLA